MSSLSLMLISAVAESFFVTGVTVALSVLNGKLIKVSSQFISPDIFPVKLGAPD